MVIVIVGLVLLTVILIAAGFWLMQQEQAPGPPAGSPAAPSLKLPSIENPPAPPPSLPWKRPFMVPWALTRGNAGMAILYGVGLTLTIPFLYFWFGGFELTRWSNFSPFACIFTLPFVAVPLYIVGTQAWMLFRGVRDWQRVQALEAQGQLAQGVLFDRWSGLGRGSHYCIAYYFELPWGNPGGGPVIRAEVNRDVHRAYRIGDVVQVRYLPDNPQVCRAEVAGVKI